MAHVKPVMTNHANENNPSLVMPGIDPSILRQPAQDPRVKPGEDEDGTGDQNGGLISARREGAPPVPPSYARYSAARSTSRPWMIRPLGPAETLTVVPSAIWPSRIMLASGFCSARWITRFRGRAP
jgi:hypothetical protein